MSESSNTAKIALGVGIWALLKAAGNGVYNAGAQAVDTLGLIGYGLVVKTPGGYLVRKLINGTATTVVRPDGQSGDIQVNVNLGTLSTQAASGSDPRFNVPPSLIGGFSVDTGTEWIERKIIDTDLPAVITSGAINYPVVINVDTYGRIVSYTSGSAPAQYGSAVTLASYGPGSTWSNGEYLGPANYGASVVADVDPSIIIPWIAPCDGVLKDFSCVLIGASHASPANVTYTAYKASATTTGPGAYAVTSVGIIMTDLGSGAHNQAGYDSTHSISVLRNDCILFRHSAGNNTTFGDLVHSGMRINGRFVPSSP